MERDRRRQETEVRRQTIWRLRLDGWTQERIADHLGIRQQSVSALLQQIEKRMAEEFREQALEIKARQTAQLEYVYSEAIAAWHKSCEDSERVTTTTGRTTLQQGTTFHLPDLEARTTETQCGCAAHLGVAMKALSDVRDIWGLNGPVKQEWSGPGGMPIVFAPVRITEIVIEKPALPEPE